MPGKGDDMIFSSWQVENIGNNRWLVTATHGERFIFFPCFGRNRVGNYEEVGKSVYLGEIFKDWN